jgi:hypothetical protein
VNTEDLAALGEYWNATWDTWCDLRGGEFPLASNLEFLMVRELFVEGVPLRVVLRGLKDLQGRPTGERKSLTYARGAILAEIRRWGKSQQL